MVFMFHLLIGTHFSTCVLIWFQSSLSGCKTIAVTGNPLIYTYAQLFASDFIVIEVTNLALFLHQVISMFSLDFINYCATFKVDRIQLNI